MYRTSPSDDGGGGDDSEPTGMALSVNCRVCMYVCMYVCIDIKSLPHIAWRLQLVQQPWSVISGLFRHVMLSSPAVRLPIFRGQMPPDVSEWLPD